MSGQSSIFRKVSLDRLSSPEQLDQKLTIVPPIGWTVTISLAILIAASLVWGFLGIISNKVNGSGVLMYSDGITRIISQTSGQVAEVQVQAGNYVEKGQIIARVKQDDLIRQIDQVRENIAALETVNAETLDIDIFYLNTEIYSEFAPLAGEIRSARIQYESQRAEAEKNEQDVNNQKTLQRQQVSVLERQISSLEDQIAEYENLLSYQRQVELENAQSTDNRQDVEQSQLDTTLKQMQESLSKANRQLSDGRVLFDAGIISEKELDSYRDEITKIEGEIEIRLEEIRIDNLKSFDQVQNRPAFDTSMSSMHSQLQDLRLQLIQAQTEESQLNGTFTSYLWGAYNQTGERISSLMEQFSDKKQVMRQDYLEQLKELQTDYSEKSIITAEFNGTISGLTIQPYDFIQLGDVLGNIVRGGLEAGSSNVVLYVPLEKGKLVEKDMSVNISPATVNREEHGYIIGNVVSVSPSSVTQEHMLSTLQNQVLVQAFGGSAAVIEVEVALNRDDTTVSNYEWSTPKGAPFEISPGTVCIGEIKVSDQRPIEMVVPFIKRLFIS